MAYKDIQPIFGDGNVNHKGNNGYGFEEFEDDESVASAHEDMQTVETNANAPYIMVKSDGNADKIHEFADTWHMDYAGENVFDDGEALSDEHVEDQRYLFFKNEIPNKSEGFINAAKKEFPEINIQLTDMFEPDTDPVLDLSDLNDNQLNL